MPIEGRRYQRPSEPERQAVRRNCDQVANIIRLYGLPFAVRRAAAPGLGQQRDIN